MTPQELREVFEATFAGFVAQLEAIHAQDEANRQDPSKKGTLGYMANLTSGALWALDLMEVVGKWPDAPEASLHARTAEFVQVAAHALALNGQKEHHCTLLGRTYAATDKATDTTTDSHSHAREILGLKQFVGLLRMIHASPSLLWLFNHEGLSHEQFIANMERVMAAFPECVNMSPGRPNEDNIPTVILPILRP